MGMRRATIVLILVLAFVGACAKKKPAPVASTAPPPAAATSTPGPVAPPPRPAERVEESIPVPAISEDAIGNRWREDLNRDSPFRPACSGLDSTDLDHANHAMGSA